MGSRSKLPRQGSVIYNLIYGTNKQQKKIIKRFKFANDLLIIPLYRIGLLPLLGLSRIFLLLITTGRKTGRRHITPLEYHRINDAIYIFSGRGEKSDWFKNLQKDPERALVRLGFRSFKPNVENIGDTKEKLEIIKWYVKTHPSAANYLFGWNHKTDDPESGILEPLIDSIPIMKLHEAN